MAKVEPPNHSTIYLKVECTLLLEKSVPTIIRKTFRQIYCLLITWGAVGGNCFRMNPSICQLVVFEWIRLFVIVLSPFSGIELQANGGGSFLSVPQTATATATAVLSHQQHTNGTPRLTNGTTATVLLVKVEAPPPEESPEVGGSSEEDDCKTITIQVGTASPRATLKPKQKSVWRKLLRRGSSTLFSNNDTKTNTIIR